MKESRVKSALQAIARRGVPDGTDLWPAIQSRLQKGALPLRWQTKWSWSLVWLILALVTLTTAAYALYRYLNDPGLQSVQDAGLFADLNATAEPNLLTPAPPFASGSGMASMLDLTQTQAGISLTLEWVYLENARQALHITASGLAPDMVVGIPQISFPGIRPEGYSGAIFAIDGEQPVTGTYLVYQFITGNTPSFDAVDMQVDIPILARADARQPVTSFHFGLSDVGLTIPWGGGGSNTYAVTVNGLEMRMQHVIFAPGYTVVRFCYQTPSSGDWVITHAGANFGDGPALLPADLVAMDSQIRVAEDQGDTCQDVNFPLGAPAKDVAFYVTVDGLARRDSTEKIDSRWQFSTYLPGDLRIDGIASDSATAGAPFASQTIGDMTATLESAYVDTNRMAFTVHFDPWQEDFSLGDVSVRLADGTNVNAGAGWGPQDSDPATALITLTPVTALKMERLTGQLVLRLNASRTALTPTTEFTFDLDLTVYKDLTIEPMLTETANGTDVILQMVKTSPSYTVVYLCYRKPAAGDWMIGEPVTLQIGPDQAGLNDYSMLYDPEYRDTGKGTEPGWEPAIEDGRCVRAGFPVGHHSKPETMVLTISSLQLSGPEVADDAEVNRALDELSKQGIEMDYMTFSGTGGGGSGPAFKNLPEGMTEAEAYQRFIEALGYVHKGPWVFTLEIEP